MISKLLRLLVLTFTIMSLAAVPVASAATELKAYRSRVVPTIDGIASDGEWTDTPSFSETTSGASVAFKHDEKSLYILVVFPKSQPSEKDFFGIEFDNNGDKAHMGSGSSPDDALFVSPAYKPNNGKDAFLMGFAKQTDDDKAGGTNDVEARMVYSSGNYVVEIRRSLTTNDSKGNDVSLTVGSSVGIGFTMGEFGKGALHAATDMNTYTLTVESTEYTGVEGAKLNLAQWAQTIVAGVVLITAWSITAVIIVTRTPKKGGS